MVIVSVAFVAIIVAALLSAAAYAYKLKLTNKNAKDNFYYVEQAMQEIYAGVGEKTVQHMYKAYTTTIENMVYYDLTKDAYMTLTNDEANAMFRRLFMSNLNSDPYFNQSDDLLAESLENYISNDTVKIDKQALHRDVKYNETNPALVDAICLQNVTLTRTQEYSNNAGSGVYTQTVTADIEISQPDFEINFDNVSTDYSNIFDYAMIADMGIEIKQGIDKNLTITGNVYAAADYYNKSYDKAVPADADSATEDDMFASASNTTDKSYDRNFSYVLTEKGTDENGAEVDMVKTITYKHGVVSNKNYTSKDDEKKTGLYNSLTSNLASTSPIYKYFDGEDRNSIYSGLYIENSNVAIAGDMIIVPGTIAVMDDSDLSIYSKESGSVGIAEVWADNIVLGGYGEKINETTTTNSSFKAPTVYLSADLYVRDDTELNAEKSTLTIRGNYYGYGNSTEKDTRVFVPTVNKDNFQIAVPKTDAEGNVITQNGNTVYDYVNRDHYNSSAIVINGQNSTLDLSKTSVLYLAGRAYIELSKNVTYNSEDGTVGGEDIKDGSLYVDANGQLTDTATNNTEVVTEKYEFDPALKGEDGAVIRDEDGNIVTYINDYKTGESLSVKSNQVAYIPITMDAAPAEREIQGNRYMSVKLGPSVAGVSFFGTFFPASVFGIATEGVVSYYVPVISQTLNDGRVHYYYDLDKAYEILKSKNHILATNTYTTSDAYSSAFIQAYVEELKKEDSTMQLKPVVDSSAFEMGNIILSGADNDGSDSSIYSSGAITVNKDSAFNMIVKKEEDALLTEENWKSLLTSAGENGITETDSLLSKVLNFSKNISTEYTYVKWNLGHFKDEEINEQNYIDQMLANGWTEDMLTPINRYMNFDKIGKDTNVAVTLTSGYRVIVSGSDVKLSSNDCAKDNAGNTTTTVKGIVVTKGDVTFDSSITRFEGLIVSGGKIFVTGNLQSITASPEICRSVLRECMQLDNGTVKTDYETIRNVFRQYSANEDLTKCPVCGADITVTEIKDEEGNVTAKKYTCSDTSCTYNNSLNAAKTLVDVDQIDYTDICSIDNWTKSVE